MTTRSERLIASIEEAKQHKVHIRSAHVDALEKRLNDKKVPHTKSKKKIGFGEEYCTFGCHPDYGRDLDSCCHAVQATTSEPISMGMIAGDAGVVGGGNIAGTGEANL